MKKAFSLLELMLVVIIVGIVYTLALSTMKIPNENDIEAFSLETLPEYLRNNFKLLDAKIICNEPCGKCKVLVDGEFLDEELDLFDKSGIKSYELSYEGYGTEKEYLPYDENDPYKQACFVLHKWPNGAIEEVVLESDNNFIYYKAGYKKVKTYTSLANLQDNYKKELNAIRSGQ